MTVKQLPQKAKRLHTCSVCGKGFNWSEESSWYGCVMDEDESPSRIKKACNEQCAPHLKKLYDTQA